jgi:hypothetical protein
MNRTGIDTNPAGHTDLTIKLRSFPLGFLKHCTDNTKWIGYGVNRTHPPAGAAFNTQIKGDGMDCIFFAPYCTNGT